MIGRLEFRGLLLADRGIIFTSKGSNISMYEGGGEILKKIHNKIGWTHMEVYSYMYGREQDGDFSHEYFRTVLMDMLSFSLLLSQLLSALSPLLLLALSLSFCLALSHHLSLCCRGQKDHWCVSPGLEFNAISDVHGSRTELATMASFFSQKNVCVCVGTDLAGMIRELRVGQLFCHHPTPWFFSVCIFLYLTNVFLL